MYTGLHKKTLLFLFRFNQTWTIWTIFKKIPQTPNFMKIHPVGNKLHADGRTYLQTWWS